jgi:YbgC/YbaW family acyl-CoA thioester hydrolase
MIEHTHIIKLHETDAAGIMFFGNVFSIVHDVYEVMLNRMGFTFRKRWDEQEFLLPLVHAEADYFQPLRPGDKITVALRVEKIGTTSFVLGYNLTRDGKPVGKARTAHVAVDPITFEKKSLSPAFKKHLEEELAGD